MNKVSIFRFRSISRSALVAATVAAAVIGVPRVALAEYIPPGEVEIRTERYIPTNTDFAEGNFTYGVSWQGIPVATAEVNVNEAEEGSDQFYAVAATAKTESIIAMVYKMRHRSESVFHADSLQPVRFSSVQKEKSREKSREVVFQSDGKIVTEVRRGEKSEKAPTSFYSNNLTLDPISAAFVARSLPVTVGTEASFDVFNGKHRYLISFKVAKLEKIKVAGKTWDAFKVIPTVKKLTDTEGEDRFKSATLWISADPSRTVLRLESKVFIGSVTIELDKISAAQPQLVRTALAK